MARSGYQLVDLELLLSKILVFITCVPSTKKKLTSKTGSRDYFRGTV
jgi:hypothetical protein